MLLRSFLDWPEDALDYIDLSYSRVVSKELRAIYVWPAERRFRDVYLILEPLLAEPMGLRQRVRLRQAVAASLSHENAMEAAADHYDKALAGAEILQDSAAFANLALDQAHLHYISHSIKSALDYALEAVEAFRTLPGNSAEITETGQIEFGLQALWEVATQYFLLEDYDTSLAYMDEARMLARRAPKRLHREASLAWTAALVHRWRGHPIAALASAHDAVTLYENHKFGSPEERARMDLVMAEVAMDAAKHLSPEQHNILGTRAEYLLKQAGRSLRRALATPQSVADHLGRARARLVETRYNRLCHADKDRERMYETIEQTAREAGDRPLQCQLWTERGDTLRADNRMSEALGCYYKALDVIQPSDASAMGVWAWRAILDD